MTGVEHKDEPGARQWRKSSFSTLGNCLEVASNGSEVLVRDSKDPAGSILRYTRDEWAAFLRGTKNGEFDDLP